jgi:hypothetical protein
LKKCDLRQVGGFLKNLDENLDAILSNNDVTHDCIDDIVSDLQDMFVNTAKSTFVTRQMNKDQLI